MLNNIKVIGFDLDNTLYLSTPEIQKRIRGKIYENISKEFDIPVEYATKLFEQFYSKHSSGTESIKSIENLLDKSAKIDIIQESVEQANFLELIDRNPELISMLQRLKSKKGIDLLTGSHYPLLPEKLERIGIENSFDYILSHEDGQKTSGDLYKKWMMKRDLPANNFFYVGDNKRLDIDVPRSFGITTCILGQYENADFQIKNILELENLF